VTLFKSAVALPGKDTEFGRASEAFNRDLAKLALRIMDQTTTVLAGTRRTNIDAEWKFVPGFEPAVPVTAGFGIITFPTAFPRALVTVVALANIQVTLSLTNTNLTQFEFRRVGGGGGTVAVAYLAVGY
jgi:hypothetical protein